MGHSFITFTTIEEPRGENSIGKPGTFLVEGKTSREVVEALAEREIIIGHGHFYGYRVVEAIGVSDMEDGVIRVSMVHYNTLEEVDRLTAALDAVI